MDIETRPYQKGDEKSLNEVFQKIYHRDFPDQYWWWKYLNNPMGKNFCYCAVFEGRIVGFVGGIPYRIKWGENEILAGQLTDVAIEPELMGKKVFSHIKRASIADILKNADIIYGIGNEASISAYKTWVRNEQRERAVEAFHVPRMVKILKTESLVKKRVQWAMVVKIAGAIGNLGLRMIEKLRSKPDKPGLTIRSIHSFDPSIDTFINAVTSGFKLMSVRDHIYLNWRYCNNLIYQYDIYVVEESGKTEGLVVLRNQPGKTHRGFILEFFAAPEREDIQHLLLKKTTEHFRQRGVDTITCWVFPHSPYYKSFRNHLFVKKRGDLFVMFTTSKEDKVLEKDFADERNWHFSCGDHETF